jgi:hypothetical protein
MSTDFTMTRGDTVNLAAVVTQNGLPYPLTGCQMWFTAKNYYTDPDASAVFQHTIGSGITIIDATKGWAQLVISPADTAPLPASKTLLVWDLEIVDSSGNVFTAASGSILVTPDVTITT